MNDANPNGQDDRSEADSSVPLSSLRCGIRARVCLRRICDEDCELLGAMGLTDRCVLRVCRRGEPCIIQIDSMRLGLSRAMASNIYVVPLPEAS